MKKPLPALSAWAGRKANLSGGWRVARVWQAGHLFLAVLLVFATMLAAAMYGAGSRVHAQDSDMTPATPTEVWSATLRPDGGQWQSGCSDHLSDHSHHCSRADRLTDVDFSFAGTDYRIVDVTLWSIGWLTFEFDEVPTDVAVEDLTLHVGERAFPFKNGRILRGSRKGPRWTNSGLRFSSWSAGAEIALRLTAPAAAEPGSVQNLQAPPGNRQVVLTWGAPHSNGGSRILDYEFRYSVGATVSSSAAWSSAGMDFTETISGLTKGQQYAFEVRARNRVGGGTAATATAALVANSVPTAPDGAVTAFEDTMYTFRASDFNFTDADVGDAFTSIEVVTLPPSMKGALNFIGTTLTAVQAGDVVNKADVDAGKLTFAPPTEEHGSPYATFTFKVTDGFDYSTSASTMTINVASVQDAPTTADGAVTTTEDTAYTFQAGDFSFADADGDTLSGVKVLALPQATKGTLSVDGIAIRANQSVPAADIAAGRFVFTPAANGNGDPYTSFSFKVSDGGLESAGAATLTVDVTAVNDPAAGKPSISGVARVGRYLKAVATAITDVDGMADVDLAYQWIRVANGSDADITGATSSTYKLAAEDLNRQIKVRVGFTDNDGTTETPPTSDAWPSGGTVQAQTDADQTLPTLSVEDATVLEGRRLAFRVMLMPAATAEVTVEHATSDGTAPAGAAIEEVTVKYATSDGTATAGEDYTAVSGTLAFAPGETEKTVNVATTADDAKEGTETITLTLSMPIFATLADATATGTMTEPSTAVGGNTLPTASDHTVTLPEDTRYSFKNSDWGFSDEDGGEELHYVSGRESSAGGDGPAVQNTRRGVVFPSGAQLARHHADPVQGQRRRAPEPQDLHDDDQRHFRERRGDRQARDKRRAPGRADVDGLDRRYRGCGRSAGQLRLRVVPGRYRRHLKPGRRQAGPGAHSRRQFEHLHAGAGRPGQTPTGPGELHRPGRVQRTDDQRRQRHGEGPGCRQRRADGCGRRRSDGRGYGLHLPGCRFRFRGHGPRRRAGARQGPDPAGGGRPPA